MVGAVACLGLSGLLAVNLVPAANREGKTNDAVVSQVAKVHLLLSEIVNAERGYLLSGEPVYLAAFDEEVRQVTVSINWVLANAPADVRTTIEGVIPAHQALLKSHVEVVALFQSGDNIRAAASALSADLNSRAAVRAGFARIDAQLQANRAKISRREGALSNLSNGVLLVLGLWLLLSGVVVVRRLKKQHAGAEALRASLQLTTEKAGELRHQAFHDVLTGLPNRTLIVDRLEQILARSRRNGTVGAVLYLDVDHFKDVNDTLGHDAGDLLLQGIAARLMSVSREVDTLGRMGGDEFVVLVDDGGQYTATMVAQRLLDVMRKPFDLDGVALPIIVTISIGISVGERPTGGELVREADMALYNAKAAGRDRYEVFDADMRMDMSANVELRFALRSALDGQQFFLVYQPVFNLDDLTVTGVEALIRWEHPTRGVIQPDEFIPILEQTGQIREIGRWVLLEACQQAATWHAKGDPLDMAVNVSARQLDSDAIVGHVREALDISGLAATSLIIEVTETSLMRNPNATALRLQAIKDLHVRISVDDFGTGYSSLAYLRQLPVDCLKIDRMFTNAITTSPESRALIGTLVQLGKGLGLQTLAEGIETTEELDELRSVHVNRGQGFLLARPLDAQTLETNFLCRPARPTPPGRAHDSSKRM